MCPGLQHSEGHSDNCTTARYQSAVLECNFDIFPARVNLHSLTVQLDAVFRNVLDEIFAYIPEVMFLFEGDHVIPFALLVELARSVEAPLTPVIVTVNVLVKPMEHILE